MGTPGYAPLFLTGEEGKFMTTKIILEGEEFPMSSLRNSMKKAALHHSHSRENGNPVFAPLIPANILDACAGMTDFHFAGWGGFPTFPKEP
jgi:hypothetical protein